MTDIKCTRCGLEKETEGFPYGYISADLSTPHPYIIEDYGGHNCLDNQGVGSFYNADSKYFSNNKINGSK